MAGFDGDSEKLYWFADDRFIGSMKSGGDLEWTPEEGVYDITAVDEAGRSTTITVSVEVSDY